MSLKPVLGGIAPWAVLLIAVVPPRGEVGAQQPPASTSACPPDSVPNEITVSATGATYRLARPAAGGSFRTGQAADITLSAIGFNNSGGPQMFNHPTGVATDGTRR